MLDDPGSQSPLLLVVSGAVEGVVEEFYEIHQCHPLGRCVSNAGRGGDKVGSHSSDGGGGGGDERQPIVCMLGPGAVLGGGIFLTYFDSMQLRARTEVTALRFDAQVGNFSISGTAYLQKRINFRRS
jgi:hypothetical protein